MFNPNALEVTVSPNPVSQALEVSGLTQEGEITIISNSGIPILKRHKPPGDYRLEVAHLPTGMYHLVVTGREFLITAKFVKL